MAACQFSGTELGALVIPVCGWREPDGTGLIRHVPVGDIEGCVSTVLELAREAGRNTYVSLAVVPRTMSSRFRGKAEQAVGIFGLGVDLDADKGCRMRPEDLPLAPAVVLATSATPDGVNRNCIYLFDRLVPVNEAKALAVDLAHIVGDRDGGTADTIHVWRVAGTLNGPKASKIGRGRAPDPQRVAFDPDMPGNAKSVSQDLLRGAIDVALEGVGQHDQEPVYLRAELSEVSGGGSTRLKPADPDAFDGDPRELARDLEALQHISSDCPRSRWRAVLAALHHRHGGSELGLQIALAWSRGGTVGHVTFEGAAHRTAATIKVRAGVNQDETVPGVV